MSEEKPYGEMQCLNCGKALHDHAERDGRVLCVGGGRFRSLPSWKERELEAEVEMFRLAIFSASNLNAKLKSEVERLSHNAEILVRALHGVAPNFYAEIRKELISVAKEVAS